MKTPEPSYLLCHYCFEVFSPNQQDKFCKKCNTKIIELFTIEDFETLKSQRDMLLEKSKESIDILESLASTAETHAMQTYSRVSDKNAQDAYLFIEKFKELIEQIEKDSHE